MTATDVVSLLSIILGFFAIISALCGFGYKLGVTAQKQQTNTEHIEELKLRIAEIDRRINRHIKDLHLK